MNSESHRLNRVNIALCFGRVEGDYTPSTAKQYDNAMPYTERHTRLATQSKQRFLRLMPNIEYQAAADAFFDQSDWLDMAEMTPPELEDIANDFVIIERQRQQALIDDEQRELTL